jgi:triphosphoribosyl-dephospho-CoA synthase
LDWRKPDTFHPLMNTFDIATLAVEALLQEVETWPKPGLVNPIDNGSHADMNAALLRRSARCLLPYFERLAVAGAHNARMSVLRQIGIAAEAAMLQATDGINTHRGAIFGLGLLCGAAGTLDTMHGQEELGTIVRRRWGSEIGAPTTRDTSHGAVVWRRYGVGGARREAIAGFPRLYEVAWSALRQGRQLADGDEVAARVQCLFALMAELEDTTLLHRGGAEGLLFARALATQFIELGGVGTDDWRERALHMHRLMVARHLSPGGSADLLAMTLFVDSVHARTRCASQVALEASLV